MVEFLADGIRHICRKKDLHIWKNELHAKWINGRSYCAKVLFQAKERKRCESYLNVEINRSKYYMISSPPLIHYNILIESNVDSWFAIEFAADRIRQACPGADIKIKKKQISAKWQDGRYYPCKIIFEGEEEKDCDEFLNKNKSKSR